MSNARVKALRLQQVPTGYRLSLVAFVSFLALSLLSIVDFRRGFLFNLIKGFGGYGPRTPYFAFNPWQPVMLAIGLAGLLVSYQSLKGYEAALRGMDLERYVRRLAFITVPARNLMPLPEGISFTEAAAAPIAFLTAWRALITRGQLRPGEDVLILGASGGVATAAIQIAKLAGARVFAVTSSPEKVEKTRQLGADWVVDRTQENWSKAVYEATGRQGVDLVLENVGAATWFDSLRAVRKNGRIVTYGATTGPHPKEDLRYIFWKQLQIIGTTMSSHQEFVEVMNLVWQGKLKPVIDRVLPLEDAREAYRVLKAGAQFGKLVLEVG